MTISLNMLSSLFEGCIIQAPLARNNRFFSSASLISLADVPCDAPHNSWIRETLEGEEGIIDKQAIYVGQEDIALDFLSIHPTAFAVAIGDGSTYYLAPRHCGSRLLLINTKMSCGEVFQTIWHYLNKILTWTQSMKQVLIEGGGYQEVLDCCDGIFNEFISINDSSFRLLAHNGKIPKNDALVQRFVEQKSHSSEVVAQFEASGAISRWQTQTGIVRVEKTNILTTPSLSYVFRRKSNYFVHVVLQCSETGITEALVDTFQILIDHLELSVKRDQSTHLSFDASYADMLVGLVNEDEQSQENAKKELSRRNINPDGLFSLALFRFADKSGTKHVLGYHGWRILQEMPDALIFPYKGDILALFKDPEEKGQAKVASVSKSLKGKACLSDVFSGISHVGCAYKQASLAFDLSDSVHKRIRQIEPSRNDTPILRFKHCFSTYILKRGVDDRSFLTRYLEQSLVGKMKKADGENGTNLYQSVITYLICNRNSKEAAARLFVHRNTLVYRIEKAQNLFGFDLDSFFTCEYILTLAHLSSLLEV